MIDGASSVPAEHAEAVGIVEDGKAAMFFGDFCEFGQAGNVALHRVNPLDHEELWRIARGRGGRDFAEIVGAVVRETFHGGPGELDAFPKARVDVFVGENDVPFLGETGNAGDAGKVAGRMHVAGFAAEEVGEFLFEFDVESA